MSRHVLLAVLLPLLGCSTTASRAPSGVAAEPPALNVGFLLLDGVYNTELTAPFDVFHHTASHAPPGMTVFTVGRTADLVTSYEGLRILPDHTLESAPRIDVLVVPSGEHSMTRDVEDAALVGWLRRRGAQARWLLSVCDGAFPLAEAGLLDGAACTTYPGDIAVFRKRYPHLEVREGVSFVVDGKRITGVGGAASFDPAMWLVERLYGPEVAAGVGRGLVIDWDAGDVKHEVQ